MVPDEPFEDSFEESHILGANDPVSSESSNGIADTSGLFDLFCKRVNNEESQRVSVPYDHQSPQDKIAARMGQLR